MILAVKPRTSSAGAFALEGGAYLASFLALIVSMVSHVREALILGLVIAASISFIYVARFIEDFPKRPMTDLLSGTLGMFVLGGAIPINMMNLGNSDIVALGGYNLYADYNVTPLSLAAMVYIACCCAIMISGRIHFFRPYLILNLPTKTNVYSYRFVLCLSASVVAGCLWMISTGTVSIDSNPYSANASASSRQFTVLYQVLFGMVPFLPALIARHVGDKSGNKAIRLTLLIIFFASIIPVIFLGRRFLFASVATSFLFFAQQRGWRIRLTTSLIAIAALIPIFLTLSTVFLAFRGAQDLNHAKSISTLAQEGQSTTSDNVDAATRSASRLAILGELANLVTHLPSFGAAHGQTLTTNLAMIIPDALWPGKGDYHINALWDDGKIEDAAGNPAQLKVGDHYNRADIGSTLVVYSFADFGFLAPVWCALQALLFFATSKLVGRIAGNNLTYSVVFAMALIYCLVPDATGPASYIPILRSIIINVTLISVMLLLTPTLFSPMRLGWSKGRLASRGETALPQPRVLSAQARKAMRYDAN